MEKKWDNVYTFKFSTAIREDSVITPFMVKHKMFPGRTVSCSVNMEPCNSGYTCGGPKALKISVKVMKSSNIVVDKFTLTQGQFCKVMSNVYSENMSVMKDK